MAVHPNSLANLRSGRRKGARNRAKLPTLQEVAKPAHVRKAWARLVSLTGSEDDAVALRAAGKVLDYACGKPRQSVEVATGPGLTEGEFAERYGLDALACSCNGEPDRAPGVCEAVTNPPVSGFRPASAVPSRDGRRER